MRTVLTFALPNTLVTVPTSISSMSVSSEVDSSV